MTTPARVRSALRPQLLPLALLALLLAAPARAELQVSVERIEGGAFRVAVDASVAAPAPVLWGTMTDYEKLPRFVPDLRRSRVASAPGEPVVLEQEGVARLFFRFTIRVRLAIETEEGRIIRFRRVGGNLAEMSGAYRLVPDGDATRLSYEARLRPAFWVPSWIGTGAIKRLVTRQIVGLIGEAERRAAYDGGKSTREAGP